jgi:hypothetical protein
MKQTLEDLHTTGSWRNTVEAEYIESVSARARNQRMFLAAMTVLGALLAIVFGLALAGVL